MDKFSGALSSSLSLALFPVPARLSGPLPTIVASNESGDNGIDQVQHCYLTVSLHCIPTFTPPISWIGNECSIFLSFIRFAFRGMSGGGCGADAAARPPQHSIQVMMVGVLHCGCYATAPVK